MILVAVEVAESHFAGVKADSCAARAQPCYLRPVGGLRSSYPAIRSQIYRHQYS